MMNKSIFGMVPVIADTATANPCPLLVKPRKKERGKKREKTYSEYTDVVDSPDIYY